VRPGEKKRRRRSLLVRRSCPARARIRPLVPSKEEGCISGRSEEGEKKKRKRPKRKVTAVRSEPSGGTLRKIRWAESVLLCVHRCMLHHVSLSLETSLTISSRLYDFPSRVLAEDPRRRSGDFVDPGTFVNFNRLAIIDHTLMPFRQG